MSVDQKPASFDSAEALRTLRVLIELEKTRPDDAKIVFGFFRKCEAAYREFAAVIDGLIEQDSDDVRTAGLAAQYEAFIECQRRLTSVESERDRLRALFVRVRNATSGVTVAGFVASDPESLIQYVHKTAIAAVGMPVAPPHIVGAPDTPPATPTPA